MSCSAKRVRAEGEELEGVEWWQKEGKRLKEKTNMFAPDPCNDYLGECDQEGKDGGLSFFSCFLRVAVLRGQDGGRPTHRAGL